MEGTGSVQKAGVEGRKRASLHGSGMRYERGSSTRTTLPVRADL